MNFSRNPLELHLRDGTVIVLSLHPQAHDHRPLPMICENLQSLSVR